MKPAWPEVRLDDCCRIVSGATPSTGEARYWGGDIYWATPKDLGELDGALISDTPRRITEAGLASCSAEVLPSGSVLFSSRAPIGHVAINTVPMATNQGFKSFIPDPTRLDAKFLYWWLRSNRPYLESLGNGATFKEVSKAVVSRIKIPLPPVDEQRRVANVLDQAERILIRRRRSLDRAEELARSTFVELFGDPMCGAEKWPLVAFGQVCETRLGKMLDQKRKSGRNLRPYLRNANVQWFRFDLRDLFQMDFDEGEREVFRLKSGDLLICEGGEPGRAAIWRGELSECYYQKALHRARPLPNMACPEYLVWLLRTLAERQGLADHVTSATIAHLTGEKLKAMRIPLPPLALQQEFARKLASIERVAVLYSRAVLSAEALFSSLQYRAFRGEL